MHKYGPASPHLNNYSSTGVVDFFCERPRSKYFSLCRSRLQRFCCSTKGVIDSTLTNEWLCSKKVYLQTLRFEFYVTFICHAILFSFLFIFSAIKNMKIILSSQNIQKQVIGQIWPVGYIVCPCCRIFIAHVDEIDWRDIYCNIVSNNK